MHWFQAVQGVYGIDKNSENYLDLKFRRRLLTLQSVEDMIEKLIQKMEAINKLENTYIIFTSDNGYHLGKIISFISF